MSTTTKTNQQPQVIILTEENLPPYLHAEILAKYGSVYAYAKATGTSKSFLSGMINGKAPIPDRILKEFGIYRAAVALA